MTSRSHQLPSLLELLGTWHLLEDVFQEGYRAFDSIEELQESLPEVWYESKGLTEQFQVLGQSCS